MPSVVVFLCDAFLSPRDVLVIFVCVGGANCTGSSQISCAAGNCPVDGCVVAVCCCVAVCCRVDCAVVLCNCSCLLHCSVALVVFSTSSTSYAFPSL